MANSFHVVQDSNKLFLRLRKDVLSPEIKSVKEDAIVKQPSRPVLNNSLKVVDETVMNTTMSANVGVNTIKQATLHAIPENNSLDSSQVFQSNVINTKKARNFRISKPSFKLQSVFLILALTMVITGVYVSYSAWQTNRSAQAAAIKLTREANKNNSTLLNSASSGNNSNPAISTVKPTHAAYVAYSVAPDYPKYLKIPSIYVDARVLQVNLLPSGALGTPNNVYDTAWYVGSSEPGQPGATLIDGHISSWTSHGVFYNLNKLKPGNKITIVKGDNSVVNYVVVSTQTFSSNSVNMSKAMTPIDPSTSGLNLISCYGQVIKGTSLFNKRIIVFAKQV